MTFLPRKQLKQLGKLIDEASGRNKSCPKDEIMASETEVKKLVKSDKKMNNEERIGQSMTFKTLELLKKKREQNTLQAWHLVIAEYEVFYNNGWVPISSNIMFNQMKPGYTEVSPISDTHIQTINTDINKVLPIKDYRLQDEIEGSIETIDENRDNNDKCSTDVCKSNIGDSQLQIETGFVPNVFQMTLEEDKESHKPVRRSKKLTDYHIRNVVETLPKANNSSVMSKEINDKSLAKKAITDSKIRTYEVTEKSIFEDIFEQQESEIKETGYNYGPPAKQNLTNGLFQILSKYKIKPNDVLPNYVLSRRRKAHNPLKANLQQKPFQVPYLRYNNLNHLPVDPLLAVFLSNYGYYLQGLYGIQNNYNNLYGYLAANNIHNNRPFGGKIQNCKVVKNDGWKLGALDGVQKTTA